MRYLILASLVALSVGSAHANPPTEEELPDFPVNIEDFTDMDEEKAEEIIGSINPLENDLRGLDVAIRLHQGFVIKPDGAFFQLGVTNGAGEELLDEEFTLLETFGVENATLTAEQRDDFVIRTFELDPEDYPRMQARDMVLQELKRTSPGENLLRFNAGAKTCANPDLETPDQYRLALFVRTAPDVDFVPLSTGDLIVDRDNAGPFAFAWDACES